MASRTVSAVAFLIVAASSLAPPCVRAADELPPNMTVYYFGVLMRGPAWSPGETPERAALQEAHLAHMTKMHADGKLVLAGPLMDGTDWRGIVIYRTKTRDEAQTLADQDPAVKAGRLQVTIRPWLIEKGILPDPLAAVVAPPVKAP